MSSTELTRVTGALARALSIDDIDQIGRDTGQSERLRTITPGRLFLSLIVALGSGKIESIADLLREFNHQNGVAVAYKAFYNRLAREQKAAEENYNRLSARLTSSSSESRNEQINVDENEYARGAIKLSQIGSTAMACLDPAISATEGRFMGAMQGASSVSIDPAGRMILDGSGGSITFEVAPQQAS